MPQLPGRRWSTRARDGESHAAAGRKGGAASAWAPPRSLVTRREAAMRWAMGDGTQAALAAEYGVCRSTVRRWCMEFEAAERAKAETDWE